jgi:hypothetical protein
MMILSSPQPPPNCPIAADPLDPLQALTIGDTSLHRTPESTQPRPNDLCHQPSNYLNYDLRKHGLPLGRKRRGKAARENEALFPEGWR